MCGGGTVPNVPATISDSSDPTHSLVRLTSHNLKTREPHTKNTSPACSQPPVPTAAGSRAGLFSPCTPKAVFGERRVLILCCLFLSIKTFEGGGPLCRRPDSAQQWFPGNVPTVVHTLQILRGSPLVWRVGAVQPAVAPPLPTPQTAATPQPAVLGDFQRGGNVALGTPWYWYEA